MKKFLSISFIFFSIAVFGQNSLEKDLRTETMLHPADAFSALVFKKNEFAYNQAITPYPSWAWWGITDWVTAELDFEAWLGGVPSFNFRFGIIKQKKFQPAIAFETMFQYLKEERDQFFNLDYLAVNRQGVNWYNHVNMTWQLKENWYFHLMGGATYAENLEISNGDSLNYKGRSNSNLISPDFSVGLDWKAKRWITFHSTVSYGSTFLYADNIARKQQFVVSSRIAPFIKSRVGFLNSFRIELTYLYNIYGDADESFGGPIGFAYWQWDWSKENRQRRKQAKNKE